MIILERPYTIQELIASDTFPNGFIKGVVDLKKDLVALHADMHYELAEF